MNPIVRNILAFVAGFVVGSAVNIGIIQIGSAVIPPPSGVDATDMASINAAMDQGLYQFHHFITPWLAHALGTLAGALVVYRFAASAREVLTWGLGTLFLVGGIAAARMIPAPGWFIAIDLVFAYLPMAWLAIRLGAQRDAAAPEPSDT